MALTECPECKGQVSDKAEACPHCGVPVEVQESVKQNIQLEETQNNNKTIKKVCTNCGYEGDEKLFEKYSDREFMLLEIFLTLFGLILLIPLILPGLLFLIPAFFLYIKKKEGAFTECPECKAKNPIKADSPKGKEILANRNNP